MELENEEFLNNAKKRIRYVFVLCSIIYVFGFIIYMNSGISLVAILSFNFLIDRKLLSKTQTTLKYPKSPRLEQLAPPRYLESDKQKHRPKHHLQAPKTPAGRLKEDDNVSVVSAISVEN